MGDKKPWEPPKATDLEVAPDGVGMVPVNYSEVELRIIAAMEEVYASKSPSEFERTLAVLMSYEAPIAEETLKSLEDFRKKWLKKFRLLEAYAGNPITTLTGRFPPGAPQAQELPKKVGQGPETGRMSAKSGFSELPTCDHGIMGDCIYCKEKFEPCSDGCRGWLHVEDPYQIEACDDCGRFKGDFGDDAARVAHEDECDCGWPSFDYLNASSTWLFEIEEYCEKSDLIQLSNMNVLRNLVITAEEQFVENIVPVIFLCKEMLEREWNETGKTAIRGMLTLYEKIQEMVKEDLLTASDFEEFTDDGDYAAD